MFELICTIVFFALSFLIFYSWVGYYLTLKLIVALFARSTEGNKTEAKDYCFPMLSVVIAARNEEKNIEERIKNLLRQEYPSEKIEIIVASDGSTDMTAEVSNRYAGDGVRTLDFKENRGRAMVHNDSVLEARGEIVVFTDAETRFEEAFCEKIALSFADPCVGAAVGRLVYSNQGDSGITKSASKYWDLEARLRRLQSALGLLSFGTGACTAFRKNLYRPISPTEDIDYAQTMNVVIQGAKVVFVPEAVAYDIIAGRPTQTFRNRVRQTSRGHNSMMTRLFTVEILKRPHVFASILFHKPMRHFTPFMLIGLFFANMALAGSSPFYTAIFILQCLFYLSALGGYVLGRFIEPPRPLAYSWTFCLLNAGRLVGVLKSIAGRATDRY